MSRRPLSVLARVLPPERGGPALDQK